MNIEMIKIYLFVQKDSLISITMTQKSPTKQFLLHPIENHRNICQITKDSVTSFSHIQNNVGINTDQFQLNRHIGTNTPNYAEQIARAIDHGNAEEEIDQMLMQGIHKMFHDELRRVHCSYFLPHIIGIAHGPNL
jgi:hypothetical protein